MEKWRYPGERYVWFILHFIFNVHQLLDDDCWWMQRLRVCLNDIQFKSLPVALKIMTLNTVFDLSFISFTKFTSCLTIVDGSNRNCVWFDFNIKNYCDRSWQDMFDLSFIPNVCQLLHDCWWLQYLRICLIESLLVALKKRWSRQVVLNLTFSLKVIAKNKCWQL